MALDVYRKKRKFDVTPEPRGRQARAKQHEKRRQFVIQKHAARRLHYDLRLEHDGVMKSWAVTRGPSLVPGEKRLAVQVEDHPVEYNKFEGTIPEGQYGGGTVMIWDRGTWTPDGDVDKGLRKGHLDFTLDGEKLQGRWHLVRMRGRPHESRENWLLIKAHDEAAREPGDLDILEEEPLSVASGRSIPEIAAGKGGKRVWHSNRNGNGKDAKLARGRTPAAPRMRAVEPRSAKPKTAAPERAKSARGGSKSRSKTGKANSHAARGRDRFPDFVPPSLATLREQVPDDSGWVHEIKLDGYRIQARLDAGEVRLLTRKGLDWVDRFANVAEAVAALPAATALIDGEVVVEDENGVSSFSALQAALKDGRGDRFIYCVFDLLYLDGEDLRARPLTERKAALKDLVGAGEGPIRYSEHFDEKGSAIFDQACRMGLEGIVSKRKDAPYRGGRSDTFIKIKCANAQEFVVGGYSLSTALPNAIGALAVGYHEDGRLIYAGRIGTGYTRETAKDLWKRLHPLEIDAPVFDQIPEVERRRRDVRWVEPKMVIEAQFRGWTADALVRQASFKGVREDKPAREVVRELPGRDRGKSAASARVATKAKKSPKAPAGKSGTAGTRGKAGAGHRGRALNPTARRKPAEPRNEGDVHFTHPDRVYWTDVGVTKQDLADFYRAVWDWMAPHVVGRPLALLRCPDGTTGECFFQKHANAGLLKTKLHTVIDKKGRQVIAVEHLDGLLSLVQVGVLEVHVRGSRIERLDLCDRIVFDLDPGEGASWADIVAAARDVRERLEALRLESFVKLSGGKGLHVVVPIAGTDWDTTKVFVQAFAQVMAADEPERYVAKMTKSLRPGRIFVDYLRNSLEQTSVAAYSTRARAGAAVSVPVSWHELGRISAANQFTVLNLLKRLSGLKQNPWSDIGRVKQKLPDLKTLRGRG